MEKRKTQGRRVPFWRSLQLKYALTDVVIVAAVGGLVNAYQGVGTPDLS